MKRWWKQSTPLSSALSGAPTTATLAVDASHDFGELRLGLQTGVIGDLSYDETVIEGTSSIPGYTNFSQSETYDHNAIRLFVGISVSPNLTNATTMGVGASLSQNAYDDNIGGAMSIGLSKTF